MLLSKLNLNPRSRQVSIDKGRPYELHRSIMLAFPGFDHESERILFRLEISPPNQVLVQSSLLPDWNRLAEDYLVNSPEMKSLDMFLRNGQLLRFRLRANPSKRDPKSHKRVGLYTEEDRLQWLLRKGDQHGFSFQQENIVISEPPWTHLSIPSSDDGKKVRTRFNFVDFNGVIQVADSDLLMASVRQGIGSGKGFGCGLLSLAAT